MYDTKDSLIKINSISIKLKKKPLNKIFYAIINPYL